MNTIFLLTDALDSWLLLSQVIHVLVMFAIDTCENDAIDY